MKNINREVLQQTLGSKIKYKMFPLPQPTRKNWPDPKYFIPKTEMIFLKKKLQ